MISAARKAFHALAWLAAAAPALSGAAQMNLGKVQETFPNSKAVGHNVCFVIDGARVAVLGTAEDEIVGVLAYPNPPKDSKLMDKLARAMQLENTDIKYFGDKKHPAAFTLCKDVATGFNSVSQGAFGETLGESIAFIAAGGDFTPDRVAEDAFVWKMSAANMQVAFPLADGKIQVLEAIGAAARSMNTHKAEKLWEKLGMPRDGKEIDRNTSKMIAKFIGCDAIFFSNRSMDKDFWKNFRDNKRNAGGKNKKVNMSVIRTDDKRILVGDEEILLKGDPGRSDFDTLWPAASSSWPDGFAEEEKPKVVKRVKPKEDDTAAAVEKEDVPEPAEKEDTPELTPTQAMDAYLRYLQEL